MLQSSPVPISDFTGGLTDSKNSPQNCYLQAYNLLLTEDGTWVSRPGTDVYDSTDIQLPTGAYRVGKLINFNNGEVLFAQCGSKLYRYGSGVWNVVQGPTGNDALIGVTTAGQIQVQEWKKHILITSSEQAKPVKVMNVGGTWKAYTAGLPTMALLPSYNESATLTNAINLAVDIKTVLNKHFNNTSTAGLHKSVDSTSTAMLPGSAPINLSTLISYTNSLQSAYLNHLSDVVVTDYHRNAAVQFTLREGFGFEKTSGDLDSEAEILTITECVERLNDIAEKVFAHKMTVGYHTAADTNNNFTYGKITGVHEGPYAELNEDIFLDAVNNIKNKLREHYDSYHASTSTFAHKALEAWVTPSDVTAVHDIALVLNSIGNTNYAHESDAQLISGWVVHIAKASVEAGLTTNYTAFGSEEEFGINRTTEGYTRLAAILDFFKTTLNSHFGASGAHRSATSGNNQKHNISFTDIELASYNYALIYAYTYEIGGTTYKTVSEPVYFEASDVISIDIAPLTIENMAILSNGTSYNYDTSSIKIEIYRTINAGTTYYYVDSINMASSYADSTSDDKIQARGITLYTTGGALANTQCPAAKFCHIVSNVTLYANTPDNPSRIYQAKPSVIDGVSGFTYLDLPSECMGVSSHLGVKLAWTADRTYRVEGSFDATGNGSMSYIPISSDTGLKASFSPVQTDYGVVFFGGDGIYKTDGYTVTRISSKWRTTYATFVSTSAKCGVIQGTYDIKTKRVWWTINANSSDCDSILVLDLNFALNDNAVFSIFNGASSASLGNTFRPSALVSFSDVMIQGDTKGIVMKYDESYTYDMRVNEGAAYSTWGKMWIPYSYISSEMDFGTIKTRKWIPQMNFKAMNKGTNLSLQFVSVNDDGRVTSDLRPVRYRGSGKTIEEKRKFPAGSLRCGTKRIQFKNAKVVITNSDTLGQATLNTTANTLTLLSGTWPGSGAGDYAEQYISFDNDSYVTEWAIASTSSGVMTISDTGNTLPANGTYKWMIRGYPKDEKLELVSYSLDVALLGPSQQSAKGESGDNA